MAIELGYPDPAAERELLISGDRRARIADARAAARTRRRCSHGSARPPRCMSRPALLDYVQALLAASRGTAAAHRRGAQRGLSPRAGLLLVAASARLGAARRPADGAARGRAGRVSRRSPATGSPAARAPAARRRRRCCARCRCPDSRFPAMHSPASNARPHVRLNRREAADLRSPTMATLPLSTSWFARARSASGDSRPAIASRSCCAISRIYILPTRRGLALIATLAIMLLTSMNYALSLGYAMTFVARGHGGCGAARRPFAISPASQLAPLAAGEAFAGGEVDVHAVARQPAIASASVSSSRLPTARRQVIDLPARRRGRWQLTVVAPRRGRSRWAGSPCRATFRWVCGAAGRTCIFRLTACVYPAPEARAPAVAARPPGHRSRNERRAPPTPSSAGLRDYQRGDPLNRIAWKAVARGGRLVHQAIRRRRRAAARSSLDWSELPPGTRSEESRLSRLTAWILAAERETRAFALRLPGTELRARTGRRAIVAPR